VVATVRTVLRPRVLLGSSAVAVLGGDHGSEDRPALSLWVGHTGHTVVPVRLTAQRRDDDWLLEGLDDAVTARHRTLLLLADPYSYPADALIAQLAATHPSLAVIGGMASAARGPGGNRLVLDGAIDTHGAVGVLLPDELSPDIVVSQGCRPIGQPYVVTKAERSVVYELGGRPALERLMEIVGELGPDDRALAAQGLHCGLVVEENKLDYERGDFLIRAVIGADRQNGAIAIGDEVPVGATVQFQVRDAATAGEDLEHLLAGHAAAGALVFTCNGRGTSMFGDPHHDASIVHELIGPGAAVAGMFCAGEIGPIGGRNAIHGFTASVALFHD
jgi:small ligand-binding sensory domain FIST